MAIAERNWLDGARRLGVPAGGYLLAERARWTHWIPVLFGCGIGFYFALPAEPPWWPGPLVTLCAAAGWWISRGRLFPGLLLLAIAIMAAGFTTIHWRSVAVAAPVLEKQTGPLWLEGTVDLIERFEDGSMRMTIRDPQLPDWAAAQPPVKIRLRAPRNLPAIGPGDSIGATAMLLPPSRPVYPGGYDFSRRAWFEQLGAVGYTLGHPQRLGPAADTGPPSTAALRDRIAARIAGMEPGPSRGVSVALMTGHRSYIPEQAVENLRATGLAHLLAISGLHIGLISGVVFFACRALLALSPALTLRYPIKKWAAAAALLAALAYLFISGASIPTQRAFIMTAIVLAAVMLERTAISMRLLAWAALFILVAAPESLTSVSFQLSFAAVTGLVSAYEALNRSGFVHGIGRRRYRLLYYAAGVLLTTLIAETATGPVAAFHFNRVVTYGLLANLIAVPVMAFWIMPWVVAAFILLAAGLQEAALTPMGWGIDLILWLADTLAHRPASEIGVKAGPPEALGLIAIGGLWLCLWQLPWRFAGLLPIAAGFVLWAAFPPPDLIVHEEGRLIAYRGMDDMLYLSTLRAEKRTAARWRENYGLLNKGRSWDDSPPDNLGCDDLGCVLSLRTGGERHRRIAFINDPAAIFDDCGQSDIIISRHPVRVPCPSTPVIIDRFDLWRHGTHAFWLGGEQPRIGTITHSQGNRPWTYKRARNR